MRTVLVTGSTGFIGKNVLTHLKQIPDLKILTYDKGDSVTSLHQKCGEVDTIIHLAGVNRPQMTQEFEEVNLGLTETLLEILKRLNRKPRILYSSSIQASCYNPYGQSKKKAEDRFIEFSRSSGAPLFIFRLPNVFGKWARENYNSVVATFCHNTANQIPLTITNPDTELELVYIDDVIHDFLDVLRQDELHDQYFYSVRQSFRITLGELARIILSFKEVRASLILPDFSDRLTECLYATYLSYLSPKDLAYPLETKTDSRGNLVELIKSPNLGQIFISKSNSGVIRGNHYHQTKIEKFCVLQGDALVQLRHVLKDEVLSYRLSGLSPMFLDIPPGYHHRIINLSEGELIVLFWSSEMFDPKHPDTYSE